MQNKLHDILDAMASHLAHCFELARQLDAQQFHQAPAEGEWSVCQVLEHIVQSETGTLGYMLKKSSSGWEALEVEQAEHQANGDALSDRLRSNEKYKAPSILPEPPNTTTLASLEQDWPLLREKLMTFLKAVPTEHYDKLVFKQPYAGMISAPRAAAFLSNHIAHHIPQIQSIIQRIQS
jgi:hypothetical protein